MSDLNTLKLTTEELNQRKMAHRSQNLDFVKEERLKKHVANVRSKERQQSSSSSHGQVALLREILSRNDHFYDALEDSDRLLTSVRDLLGVDPKKYQGVPYVTRVPHRSASDRSLPEVEEVRSRLDVNSDSVMDKSALNDEEQELSISSSDSEGQSEAASFQAMMDLTRFRQLIREAEQQDSLPSDLQHFNAAAKPSKPCREPVRKSNGGRPGQISRSKLAASDSGHDSVTTEVLAVPETPVNSPRAVAAAMNDTGKVKRLRPFTADARTHHDKPDVSTAVAAAPTMDDFHRVLDVVHSSLSEYEKLTGRQNEEECNVGSSPASFSGYTMALLEAVAKMSVYIKETEVRWRAESIVNEHLTSDILQLHNLVDAMTTDLMAVQDEYARLRNEFVKHRRDTEQQIQMFTRALTSCGISVEPKPPAAMMHQQNSHIEQVNGTVHVEPGQPEARTNVDHPAVTVASEAEYAASQPTADFSSSSYQQYRPLSSHSMSTSLNGSGHQHQSHVRPASAYARTSHDVRTELPGGSNTLDARRDAIRQQMIELNRQRLLAQAKVDELRHQEQQFTQQPFSTVSPSVSPITVASEQSATASITQQARDLHLPQNNAQVKLRSAGGATRRIVVNVPHAVTDDGVPHQFPLTS